MLFKSNGKFIDDITDSFNRFGIETKLAEKGVSKNTQKFEMYDTIHDSGYVAVAVDKPAGKTADKEWENIIENDLIPTLTNNNNVNSNPASALIVPSRDIDMVEKLLVSKGLSPSIYQLFPGYVVAGISKHDTAKIVGQYNDKLEKQKQEEKAKEEREKAKQQENNTEKNPVENPIVKEKNKEKQEDIKPKAEDIEKKKLDTLNQLSNIESKPAAKPYSDKKQAASKKEEKIDLELPKKPSSSLKKLATAALLGTAIGAGAAAYPEIKEKINDYKSPQEEKIEQEILNNAAQRYFEGLKNGYEKDDELLRIISENPQLAEKYINELANTPVQTSALKNKSIPSNILRDKSLSDNEAIRASVAENPNTPPDVLERLSKDPSNKVLESLAKNPSIPQNMMEELSNFSGLHDEMMENPGISPDIMRKITAGKNRDCEFNKKYMANPCITVDELIYNINNPDECVRQGIALNPNTPQHIIQKLANDSSPVVKNTAYKHKNMPVEEINKLFPKNWVAEPNDLVKESARTAALENPNISPEIRKKAFFMDPGRYGKAVASNKNVSPELINKMKNIAQGKKGVEQLLQKANNIHRNPEQLNQIKSEMNAGKETAEKPVRRMLNKQFVEHVYDPYQLIDNMRRVPSSKKKYNLNNNDSNNINSGGNTGSTQSIVPATIHADSTILDRNGNPPEYFAKSPLPPLNPGAVSYNPDAEKQALKVADDIINNIMKDVLPDIERSLQSSSYIPNNTGGYAGNNQAGVQNNAGSSSSLDNSPVIKLLSKKDKEIYENACREIDKLHKMF